MDLDDVRAFIKVAELASFSRAAEQLGTSKSRVSLRVSALEAVLGSRLLSRSTRAVRLTSDGEHFLNRARRLVLEADELAALFQAPSTTRGRLRVDLPLRTAHEVVIPRLGEFLLAHPLLEVLVSSTDRRVDVVREGFDCVLRVGPLVDSELAVRKLGVMSMVNLASPAYLARHGTPRAASDLSRHYVVHYAPTLGTGMPSFEYEDGGRYRLYPMRSLVTVNNAIAYTAACLGGLGIIQAPRYGSKRELAEGSLVEVLPNLISEPMPVSILYPHARTVPKRVRAFMSWLEQLLAPQLG